MGIPQGYVLDLVSKLERYTKTLFNATFGSGKKLWYLTKFHVNQVKCTLFESENDWQKIEQVPIPLPRLEGTSPMPFIFTFEQCEWYRFIQNQVKSKLVKEFVSYVVHVK